MDGLLIRRLYFFGVCKGDPCLWKVPYEKLHRMSEERSIGAQTGLLLRNLDLGTIQGHPSIYLLHTHIMITEALTPIPAQYGRLI